MVRTTLIPLLTLSICALASADSLAVTAGGTFSPSDTPDAYVIPNDPFSLSFFVDSNPVIPPADSTSVSFDVPVADFEYTLNGNPVNVTPTEITFYTAADGGGFAVDFADAEFLFSGDQMFSGTTSDPVFTKGTFDSTGWLFLDTNNLDAGSTSAFQITPEPSSIPVVLCGVLGLVAVHFKKRARTQQ
jgi:hypothetical protein